MSKAKGKVKISFCGESTTQVTGSCYHIDTEAHKYLIECGLYQSVRSTWENYRVNTRKFKFKAREIEAIFVGHCHVDHMGLIPMLYAHHCTAPIYIPFGNKELFKILLEDCAFINQRDAEQISAERGKEYSPLYTFEDVQNCLQYIIEVPIGETIDIDNDTSLTFVGSGHILNACQVIIKTKVGEVTKTIAYTSDLGNTSIKNPYVSKFTPIEKADIVIGESTYANKNSVKQKDRKKDIEKLKSIINQACVDNHGRVLIPCFASSRTQTIITELYDIFGEDESFTTPILIDSPMACKITMLYKELLSGQELDKYKKVLSWKNLVFVEDNEESRRWRDASEPCVICSASGMLTAGRSLGWLGKILPHSEDFIVFVGYIPTEGGIGAKIKEGKYKTITVSGKRVANKCQTASLKSFSSHMQNEQLMSYYSSINTPKIVLVHGEQENKIEFAKRLQEEISKLSKTTKVSCSTNDYSVTI